MLRKVNWIMVVMVAATWLLVSQLSGQQVMTRKLDASKTVFLHELGAAAGVTDEGDEVRFIVVPPPAARPEAARSVDVREGDVVIMAAGKRVRTAADLRTVYEETAVGEELKLGIQRGEERFLVSFTRAEAPADGMFVSSGGGGARVIRMRMPGGGAGNVDVVPELGLVLSGEEGAVVVSKRLPFPGTEDLPFAEGDTITKLNGQAVDSLEGFLAAYRAVDVGATLEVSIERSGEPLDLELTKPAAPEGASVVRRQE